MTAIKVSCPIQSVMTGAPGPAAAFSVLPVLVFAVAFHRNPAYNTMILIHARILVCIYCLDIFVGEGWSLIRLAPFRQFKACAVTLSADACQLTS